MSVVPVPPEAVGGAGKFRCPLEKRCRLIVFDEERAIVECVLEEPGGCPMAIAKDGKFYCHALWKQANPTGLVQPPRIDGRSLASATTPSPLR